MNTVERLEEFLRDSYEAEILKALKEGRNSFTVDFNDIDRIEPVIADNLLERPEDVLEKLNDAAKIIVNEPVTVRIKNLPERRNVRIRNLRAVHLNKLWTIDATIKAASEVKPQIYEVVYECPSCGTLITVKQDANLLQKPEVCECGRRGDFKQTEKKLFDIRWINAIEPFEVTTGEQPGEISIFLKMDLTTPRMQKMTDPGSRLRIVGILKEMPKRIKGRLSTRMDMYFEANYVEPSDTDYEELDITEDDRKKIFELAADPNIYEKLRASIAPGIWGFDEIKESIAMQLFGGVPHVLPDGSRTRGNIHILLTGDPSTGKSVIGSSKILHNSEDKPEYEDIETLVNKQLGKEKIDHNGSDVSFVNDSSIKVLSLNPKTSKVEWKPVTAFIKHKSPETLLKITTRSGRKIIATKDHSFITIDENGDIKSVEGTSLSDKNYFPVPLKNHKVMIEKINIEQKLRTNAVKLKNEIELDWGFGFFVGMFISEGSTYNGHVSISSDNLEQKEAVSIFLKKIGLNPSVRKKDTYVSSRTFSKFLEENFYKGKKTSFGKGSGAIRKILPSFCFFAPKDFIRGLFSGLISGDGYFVNARPKKEFRGNLKIGFTTISKDLCLQLLDIFSLMGIFSTMREKPYKYKDRDGIAYEVIVTGQHGKNLFDMINVLGKKPKINEFSIRDSYDSVPCGKLIYEIVSELGYSKHLVEDSEKRRAFGAMMRTVRNRNKIGRRRLQRVFEKILKENIDVSTKTLEKIEKLYGILNANVVWDQIKQIEEIKSEEKYVYDLSIDGNETFAVNNLITHNSSLLKLISTIVPRARYVSGSGVSGAGLCTTYDTNIFLDNGSLVKIGELVEKKLNNVELKDEDYVTVDGDGLQVISFDESDLKIKPMKITKYWKLKSPEKLVKIKTSTGKEIKVTFDNPIPILKSGEIVWKKACDLTQDDYIATPRIIKINNSESPHSINFIDKDVRLVNHEKTVSCLINSIKKNGTIRNFSKDVGINENNFYHSWRGNKAPTFSSLMRISDRLAIDLDDTLPENMMLTQKKGHRIQLPKIINEDFMYLLGLIAGDGNICKTQYNGLSIRFSSNDPELLEKASTISKELFGINPRFYKHPERIPYLTINSKVVGKIAELFGIPSGKKSHKLSITEKLSKLPNSLISAYIRGLFDTDGYVNIRKTKGSNAVGFDTASEEFAKSIQILLLRFGIISTLRKRDGSISYIKNRKVISGEKYSLEIRGLKNLRNFKNSIGFGLSRKNEKLNSVTDLTKKHNTNVDVIPNISSLIKNCRKGLQISSKKLYGYKNYSYEKGRRNISRDKLTDLVNKLDKEKKNEYIEKLKLLASSDIFWDKIKNIEVVKGDKYVYDITVEDCHSFVANGMIIHNTATVRKDENMGTWVLEAGALILCNKGIISIDEFDKMGRDDQIAMHEAMSIESVSIAKASIVATLPAQTAVLAGANPKLGRFDPFLSIAEQIQIPETLLSRFDLKFALKDKPDREQDERLADHVIMSRTKPELVEPVINVNLLRKYISYARQINNVELSDEAALALKNFYVDMRNRYAGEEVPTISITLRQYEALIRLAEASAKVRLDKKVGIEDAERAIRLMKYSLSQLGIDYETGRIDIDQMEGGVTASKRRKISMVLEILADLQKNVKEVAIEDLKAAAEERGLPDVDEVVDRLKREGSIFEPRPGFLRRI